MKKILIFIIKIYQKLISPLTAPACRHIPTCSAYTIEAIDNYGAVKGSWLALKRISRCHPWGTSGYDPLPPPKKINAKKLRLC